MNMSIQAYDRSHMPECNCSNIKISLNYTRFYKTHLKNDDEKLDVQKVCLESMNPVLPSCLKCFITILNNMNILIKYIVKTKYKLVIFMH